MFASVFVTTRDATLHAPPLNHRHICTVLMPAVCVDPSPAVCVDP